MEGAEHGVCGWMFVPCFLPRSWGKGDFLNLIVTNLAGKLYFIPPD